MFEKDDSTVTAGLGNVAMLGSRSTLLNLACSRTGRVCKQNRSPGVCALPELQRWRLERRKREHRVVERAQRQEVALAWSAPARSLTPSIEGSSPKALSCPGTSAIYIALPDR